MGLKFQHLKNELKNWVFIENFSILKVEIGKNKLGILGVKYHSDHCGTFAKEMNNWKCIDLFVYCTNNNVDEGWVGVSSCKLS